MTTETIYVRAPPELKEKVNTFATSTGKSQTDAIIELVSRGLVYDDIHKQLSEANTKVVAGQEELRNKTTELQGVKAELAIAQQQVINAERAKGHLERVLGTEVGKCSLCNTPINLHWFAYQQCPLGHSRKIELNDEYKKAPGVSDAVVAGLAIVGGVMLANELLGGNSQNA